MGISIRYHTYIFASICILTVVSCASRKNTASKVPVVNPVSVAVKKDSVAEVKVPIKKELQRSVFTIRLLLPLRLQEHFSQDTLPEQPLFFDNSVNAMHFYLGAMAARDSLKNGFVELNIQVLDIASDSLDVLEKLKKSGFKSCNLVISMLPPNLQDQAVKIAMDNSCPIVLPGNSNTQVAVKNSEVWLASPANSTQLLMMSEYLYQENPGAQFIALSRSQRSENILANFMAKHIDSLAQKPVCKVIDFRKDKWEEIQKIFQKGKRIILIMPTSDESYLQSVLNKLKNMDDGYQIRLAGLPAWENFESVDPSLLAQFETTIFSSMYIDVDNASVQKFRKAFIDANHSDPLPQAYQAFDLIQYFTKNFAAYGKKQVEYQPIKVYELPAKGLQFDAVCPECGYENKSLNILHYGNYKISRVVEYQR